MTGRDLADEIKAIIVGDRFLELARDLGGKPRKAGADWRCPCFLHGGSGPNLVLTPSSGLWHCLSTCGGGDAITMVMRAQSIDFRDALEWLARWAGVTVDGAHRVSNAEARPHPRPRMDASPSPNAADERIGAFLGDVWRCVAECGWSTATTRWLIHGRGVEPDAAYALGCRDWSMARRELADLFDETPVDVLDAVGFVRDGRLHPAVGGCLRGDPDWAGVAVPIWRFGRAHPERWRFRLVTARATQHGGAVKSMGAYRTDLPIDFLGAGRPERLEAPEVRLAHLGSGAPGSELVLIVEGEPDWWSATETVDGRAVVLGVCGSPTRWRDGCPDLADLAALGVRRVAVCVHHGPPTKGRDGRELGHGERFAEVVAGACARAGLGFTRKLAGEGADLNDLHRAGRLRDWLADVLEVDHGR